MNRSLKLLTLIFIGASSSSYAEENQPSRHSFGVSVGSGGAVYKGSSADGDGIRQAYAFYNYKLIPQLSIEAGMMHTVDGNDFKCTEVSNNRWECETNDELIFDLDADRLDATGFVLAAKTHLDLTQNNRLYAKLGGQYYDYEFQRDKVKLESDSGFGLFVEAGWQYSFNSSWALTVGYQHSKLGDLKTNNFNIGGSYSF